MNDRRDFVRSLAYPALGIGLGSWGSEPLARRSAERSGAGEEPRSLAALEADDDASQAADSVWHVSEYGASPDAEDNQPAIQQAIDACQEAGGGVVQLPAGTLRIAKPIRLPGAADVVLQGRGRRTSTIRKTTDAVLDAPSRSHRGGAVSDDYDVDTVVMVDHADDDFNDHGAVRDLRLMGRGADSTTYGLYAPRLSRWTFHDVQIQFVDRAFFSHQLFLTECSSVMSEHVGEGFVLADDGSGDGGSTSWSLSNCYVNHARRSGYRFFGLDYSSLISCAADDVNQSGDPGAAAYRFSYARGVNLTGCGCEASRGHIVWFNHATGTLNGCRTVSVTGLEDHDTAYLRWESSRVVVSACSFAAFDDAHQSFNERVEDGSQVTYIETARPRGGDDRIAYSRDSRVKVVDEGGLTVRDARGAVESFFGHAPSSRPVGYTARGATETRNLTVGRASDDRVADVLATLISDLQEMGILDESNAGD